MNNIKVNCRAIEQANEFNKEGLRRVHVCSELFLTDDICNLIDHIRVKE